MYTAEVRIELKPGILDAEGKTTKHALELLGFKTIKSVKSIKFFQIELDAISKEDAMQELEAACKRLLANPVVNNYSIKLL